MNFFKKVQNTYKSILRCKSLFCGKNDFYVVKFYFVEKMALWHGYLFFNKEGIFNNLGPNKILPIDINEMVFSMKYLIFKTISINMSKK